MKNLTQYSLTQLQFAKSFIRKGMYYEHSDKDLAIEYYKDSIQLLLNSAKAEIKHSGTVMRVNHKLAMRLECVKKELKAERSKSVNLEGEESC